MCLTECRVDSIIIEGGKAVGVRATAQDGDRTRQISVRANHVVLACGTVYTPLLLKGQGLCDEFGQVGQHLTIHPATGMNAIMPEPVHGWAGIPQGYCIDQLKDEGILFEGAFVPPEFASLSLPIVGPKFTEAMDAYDRMAMFGFMISDKSRGRVMRGPGGQPVIQYRLIDKDIQRIQRGLSILGRVFFAAGAERLYLPVVGHEHVDDIAGLDRLLDARLSGWDLELSAYHPLGTCRMGVDPRVSVVGPDHETHAVSNLYICDGSVVPGPPGVNPQITIMALATRFAMVLDRRLQ
jgi:hypothetical protein